MSGHSKWATTKHKKAIIDSRRAKSFAKLIKNIEVAAKMGGADLSGNPTLVDAVQKAKKTSVPNDNIDRAVKRGAGLDRRVGRVHDDHVRGLRTERRRPADRVPHRQQEPRRGRGAHGDDPQRRHAWPTRAASRTTSHRKGVIVVSSESTTEDDVMLAVLEPGAEEIEPHGEGFEVITEATDLVTVRTALQDAGIDYESADVEFVPNLKVEVDADTARKVFRLIDALEDSDDVQNVFSNFDLTPEVQAELENGRVAWARRRLAAPERARVAWGRGIRSAARPRHRPRPDPVRRRRRRCRAATDRPPRARRGDPLRAG